MFLEKEGKITTFLPVSFATKMVFPTSITLTTRYYGTTHQEKDVYFVALYHAKECHVKVIDILSPRLGCVSI